MLTRYLTSEVGKFEIIYFAPDLIILIYLPHPRIESVHVFDSLDMPTPSPLNRNDTCHGEFLGDFRFGHFGGPPPPPPHTQTQFFQLHKNGNIDIKGLDMERVKN